MKLIDETGNIYGNLTVESRYFPALKKDQKKVWWLCRCSCGKYKITQGQSLRKGLVKSCGCLHRQIMQSLHRQKGNGVRMLFGMKEKQCGND